MILRSEQINRYNSKNITFQEGPKISILNTKKTNPSLNEAVNKMHRRLNWGKRFNKSSLKKNSNESK